MIFFSLALLIQSASSQNNVNSTEPTISPTAAPSVQYIPAGHWRITDDTTFLLRCPYGWKSCIGGSSVADEICDFPFTGALCALSANGYQVDWTSRDAEHCSTGEIVWSCLLSLVLLLVMPCFICLCVGSKKRSQSRELFLFSHHKSAAPSAEESDDDDENDDDDQESSSLEEEDYNSVNQLFYFDERNNSFFTVPQTPQYKKNQTSTKSRQVTKPGKSIKTSQKLQKIESVKVVTTEAVERVGEKDKNIDFLVKLKILLCALQVSACLPNTLQMALPGQVTGLLRVVARASIASIQAFPMSCGLELLLSTSPTNSTPDVQTRGTSPLTFLHLMELSTVVPLLLLVLGTLVFLTHSELLHHFSSRDKLQLRLAHCNLKYGSVLWMMTHMFFAGIGVLVVGSFHPCVDLDPEDRVSGSLSVMRFDTSVLCGSTDHRYGLAWAAVSFLLYLVFIPGFQAFLLFLFRKRLYHQQENLLLEENRKTIAFQLKPKLTDKTQISEGSEGSTDQSMTSSHDHDVLFTNSTVSTEGGPAKGLKGKSKAADRWAVSLTLLYRAYKPRFLLWESWELLERLTLVAVVPVLFPYSSGQRVVLMVFLSMVFFSVQHKCSPYLKAENQMLSDCARLQILLLSLCAVLVYMQDDDVQEGGLLDVTMVLLTLATPAVFLMQLTNPVLFQSLLHFIPSKSVKTLETVTERTQKPIQIMKIQTPPQNLRNPDLAPPRQTYTPRQEHTPPERQLSHQQSFPRSSRDSQQSGPYLVPFPVGPGSVNRNGFVGNFPTMNSRYPTGSGQFIVQRSVERGEEGSFGSFGGPTGSARVSSAFTSRFLMNPQEVGFGSSSGFGLGLGSCLGLDPEEEEKEQDPWVSAVHSLPSDTPDFHLTPASNPTATATSSRMRPPQPQIQRQRGFQTPISHREWQLTPSIYESPIDTRDTMLYDDEERGTLGSRGYSVLWGQGDHSTGEVDQLVTEENPFFQAKTLPYPSRHPLKPLHLVTTPVSSVRSKRRPIQRESVEGSSELGGSVGTVPASLSSSIETSDTVDLGSAVFAEGSSGVLGFQPGFNEESVSNSRRGGTRGVEVTDASDVLEGGCKGRIRDSLALKRLKKVKSRNRRKQEFYSGLLN